MSHELLPGTVFAVPGGGIGARLIAIGAALLGRPDMQQHVAVMHHYRDGVPWGVEGRPGGVGWVDMRKYLRSPYTVNNGAQPIDADRRVEIAKAMEASLGTPYDWLGIAADALAALRIKQLFCTDWHGKGAPGHVVCSSFAAWLYKQAALPHPDLGRERYCTPGDWADFITRKAWR